MKRIFLFLSFIFVLTYCHKDKITSKECSIPATVKNLTGLDGCGYVFELNDGTRIEPYFQLICGTPPLPKEVTDDPLYKFKWIDGKKVMISYDVMDSAMSVCMVGKVAKITCLQDLEPNKTCLQGLIERIKGEPVTNPPTKIYQYTYHGSKVYFIPQRCCDIPSILMDENCNTICSPDGGLTGNGDGNCPDFFKERTNEKIIWEDDRVVNK